MKPQRRDGTGAGHDTPAMARLHLWQIQAVRDIAVVLLLVGIVHLGYRMSVVTIPLLLGLLLAYLLEPPIAWVARKTGRVAAAVIALIVIGLVFVLPVAAGVGVASYQGVRFVSGLDRDLTRFVDQLERVLTYLERDSVKVVIEDGKITDIQPGDAKDDEKPDDKPKDEDQPDGAAAPPPPGEPGRADRADADGPSEDAEEDKKPDEKDGAKSDAEAKPASRTLVQEYASLVRQWIRENFTTISAERVAQGAGGVLTLGWAALAAAGAFVFKYIFLTPFFFFFWSVGFGQVKQFGAQLIPEKKRASTLEIIGKMDRAIAAFIRGRFTIALILSVLYTIAYWLIGVPAPLIFGPFVGVLSAVPYLPLIGWPATMLAMAIDQAGATDPYPWWWIVLAPTAVYFAFQSLDDYVLTPKIQGKNVGLSTPVILFAVLGAGALAGVYGVLIAIPIAACIKIIITDVIFPRYKDWVEGRAKDPLPLGDEPTG